jgi:hypothetical protein
MAMSLVQDGSGFPYLAPCLYQYLQGVQVHNISVSIDEIADYDIRALLEKVKLHYSTNYAPSACIHDSILYLSIGI